MTQLIDRACDEREHLLHWMENDFHPALLTGEASMEESTWTASAAFYALENGTLYAVDDVISDLLLAACPTMPDWELANSDLPAQSGYVYFDTPLAYAHGGEDRALSVVAWEMDDNGALFLAGFLLNSGDKEFSMRSNAVVFRRWSLESKRGADPQDAWLIFFAGFLRFIQEKYVKESIGAPSRPVRKRLQRSRAQSDLRIIHLRESSDAEESRDGTRRSGYSARFIWRGSWVNQWYPSLGVNRPTWRRGHIRGPEDKPLVIRNVAYLVDR